MTAGSLVSVLVQLALFVTGLVAGILARRRDGLGGALVAAGFGVQILNAFTYVASAAMTSGAVDGPGDLDRVQAIYMVFNLISALIRLVAYGLVFFGLFRLVRSRPAAMGGVR